ncbi:hypothetical protein B0T19DRAFT_61867 [Cercophora scortea]|uniref:BTB domain-containing protein n=1 Tax=Cercophora scortea TaxID=314031 RepID=A0AAE0J5A6_9PEZI|nr:hypothetical protein B0T19DRAFT_61867 [Cercophora scortea]
MAGESGAGEANDNGGEGSSRAGAGVSTDSTEVSQTLGDVMRAPSATVPDVVVLDSMPEGLERPEPKLNPNEDLWLSTADGSPIIPLRVGQAPDIETFYVHKAVLLKSKYFERALCGNFSESTTQSMELVEEDPATFHFIVAFLYEGKYVPIKPASSVLIPDPDRSDPGTDTGADSESDDSTGSVASDASAVSRRRRDRRRRREERHWERARQKHPGRHHPSCRCPQCLTIPGPNCWHCQAPRAPPPPIVMPLHPGAVVMDRDLTARQDRRNPANRRRQPGPIPPPPPNADPNGNRRIQGEDLNTWLIAYELHIDVYILANKFLLDDFKQEIARVTIDMLETAGFDAAVPEVLFLCQKLYDGLPENDPLLRMVFARVGFLQPWRKAPEETRDFFRDHSETVGLLLRETTARREDESRSLPSMERPAFPQPLEPIGGPYRGPGYYPHYRNPAPRW